MSKAEFGMIGLGTMGRNFLLNVAENGFSCVGFDIDPAKRKLLISEASELQKSARVSSPSSVSSPHLSKGSASSAQSRNESTLVYPADDLASFAAALDTPRRIMLLVPAGPIVDSVINDLLPHLEKGDIVIDGGNSHFLDTERREVILNEKGIEFLGVGVSGGEEGARHGASIMIGGKPEVYQRVRAIFEAASAKVNGEPCAAHVGIGSAGHFVKMVHNGIEYGLMQILAETYDFMLRVLRMDCRQMSETFAKWNDSRLNSFLVEITADILRKTDAETGKPLVEMVLDKAAQKGTGKWTSQAAMDLGVPIPTIDSAVSMRQISAQKETRLVIAEKYGMPIVPGDLPADGETVTSERQHDMKARHARKDVKTTVSEQQVGTESGSDRGVIVRNPANDAADRPRNDREVAAEFKSHFSESLRQLEDTLSASFIVTYAQGLSLLHTASVERKYGVNISEVAKIWRGGCIIRSALLEDIRRAFSENPDLRNLILDDQFVKILSNNRDEWHAIVGEFSESRIPSACLSSALAYFDAFLSPRLPANLIQAQRDYFGAHTYQRTDKEGIFHTPDWKTNAEAGTK